MHSVLQGMLGKIHYANVCAACFVPSALVASKKKKCGVIFVNKDI